MVVSFFILVATIARADQECIDHEFNMELIIDGDVDSEDYAEIIEFCDTRDEVLNQ